MKSNKFTYRHFLTLLIVFVLGNETLFGQTNAGPDETDYYSINPMPIDETVILEASGLTFNDEGQLVVTTRRGEVWIITNPAGNTPVFERFAQGLHEPLGIAFKDNGYYLVQRGELTRLEDTDGDNKADRFETVYRWPLTGNYHEYSYGPKFLPDGDMLVTLNLSWIGSGASLTDWRGWMLKINEDGEMTPFATGLRSPSGFGLNAEGDIFYTENQGDWIGSGWMTHLESGDFAGHPEGLRWTDMPGSPLDLRMEEIDDSKGLTLYEYAQTLPELKPPAVWFPHTIMGISTSDMLLIENNEQVGPYEGQFLVGDQGHSKIMRIYLEEVNGTYQGAVFGFREGFSSGIIKLQWGSDNTLYTGMTSRGWSSIGRSPFGIDRMTWNGRIPFEIQSLQSEPDGFTLNFTTAVDAETASSVDSYEITDFTYQYHKSYGSPVIRRETRTITRVEVADDNRSARIYVEGLRQGYINEIRAEGVQSVEGNPVLHPVAYYTLNHIPVESSVTRNASEQP